MSAKKNAFYAQSGGVTSVINATACGVIETARKHRSQIGKVFDAMDELGLWQNTIVMLWTDHGYHQGERGWWNKTLLDTYDTKVPFMAYVPEMTDSGVVSTGTW